MSTPNLRRSKREHVTRKRSGVSCVGEEKPRIHESQSKSPEVTADHSTKNMQSKVEGNQKNTSGSKRLDARGYRLAVKEKFKGLKKENGGGDKTKSQASNSSAALDSKTEINISCQTGEQVLLQLESEDRRPNDGEQQTASEAGCSRQSAAATNFSGLERSPEKRESSSFSRKRKHQFELQQDFAVSGTRSGKIYKCELPESSDARSTEGSDSRDKESSVLDDSGMDLFVSMPIGDKNEMHEQDVTENRYTGEWVQCIECEKWRRPGNIQVPRDSWRCNECSSSRATCSVSQEKNKQSLSESCAHIEPNAIVDHPIGSFGRFEGNKPSANTSRDVGDGQESANEDSNSDNNSMRNDLMSKKFVWAEIQKGRWWPAFMVVKSDQLQKNSSSLNKRFKSAELIYSDSRKEQKLVEARSFRPFWENYEELKNRYNDKSFQDAVSKAHKLYQDSLLKRNHLESSGNLEDPISLLEEGKAIGMSDIDGIDPSTIIQKMEKQLSKDVLGPDSDHNVLEECEEGSMELRSLTRGNVIETGEGPNVEAPSPAQMSVSGGKSSTDRCIKICQICKEAGELLCCDGKDCQMTFHLHCLDPTLVLIPAGDWYCPTCACKRLLHGVHSVCIGIESIWEVKDVDTELGNITKGDVSVGRKAQSSLGKEQDDLSIKAIRKENPKKQEKLYFVKYRGLSHLHNRWVNERLLIDEAPKKLSNFKKKLKEGKAVKWNPEWAEAHRLIQKRSLICAADPEGEQGGESVNHCIEWFVKWKGLGYDQCTWELENTDILASNSAKELMKAHEFRSEEARHRATTGEAVKAKKLRNSAISRLKKNTDRIKGGHDYCINLKSVNKLRELWQNQRNALVIDEANQERIMMAISFILSLMKEFDITRPVLIVTSTAGLSMWESKLLQWDPSVNTVVYCGNRNSRDVIQKLEFFEESGCVMVQIVLSTSDIVSADLNFLRSIKWEVLIIDEWQRSKFSRVIPQLEQLPVEFRLVLFNEQLKDNAAEISHLLSFLESTNEYPPEDASEHQQEYGSEYLVSLKSKLSQYIAHERKSDTLSIANMVEYWVPIELANAQLEQYCTLLISNANSLCSLLKKNDSEALRDILLSLRKCCIHPYLVDISLQSSLREGLQEAEFLDIDINASSKLQLLDNLLSELKSEGQRVLILFQMIGRSGRTSIGDILDDHIRQRFGVDSYERVDGGLPSTKKQAALQMFNSKDSGRFVFLLEQRACGTSIKLSSIDTVIIFDSDWNPLNDLRALQKVHIDAHVEYLKVFRFYSPYTLEERVLISAKQDSVLESHIGVLSTAVCQLLLRWGTSHLFEMYDRLHDSNGPNLKLTSGYNNENMKSLAKDILARAHNGFQTDSELENAVIQRVPQLGVYGKGVKLLGESENQLKEEKMPSNIFWTKLLKGRHIGKHGASGQMPRTRRKVQYCERSPAKSVSDPEEVEAKKKRKQVMETLDPISISSWLKDAKKNLASGKETNENSIDAHKGGANLAPSESLKDNSGQPSHLMDMRSPINMHFGKYPSPCSGSSDADIEIVGSNYENFNAKSSLATQAAFGVEEHADGKALRLAQQCLHSRVKPELVELCKILQLPDEVTRMADEFLSYVMNNYRLPKEPTSLLQAVQISLCCAAAGCLKYDMELDTSIELAKSHLNFECKRAEIDSVYSKLREQCLRLRGDIPSTAGQSGSRVTSSPVNSARQQRSDEMRSQDDWLSISRDDNHNKSSMQMVSIQEPSNVCDSSRMHDNQQVIVDATVTTEKRDERGSQFQTGLDMPGQDTLEEIVTPNKQSTEDDPNHTEEEIETCPINQQEFSLLDPMDVANSSSAPGPAILSNCQSDFMSPEKIKIIKEKLQARRQALLKKQQSEVAEFFRRHESELKDVETRHSLECAKIYSMYQNPEVKDAKLKETKKRHAQMVGQVKELSKKALSDLKSRQSALRDKENRLNATCLEDLNAGRTSKFLSDLIEVGSIPDISEPVAQNTSESSEPINSALPSVAATGISISISTSEQQQDKASQSESCMPVLSSLAPEFQDSQFVNGLRTLPTNDFPQNEIDKLQRACRPRSSSETSRLRLHTNVPGQADVARFSADSQTQQHPSQHSSIRPDLTCLSRGATEQCHQVSELRNQATPGISRSQIEHVDNILSLTHSFVPTMPTESSQPLYETEVVERYSSATETLTVAGSLPRGNEPFQSLQYVYGVNPIQFRIPPSSRAPQTNSSDPLYHEMLRIRKELERNAKLHEEETARIHGEFEKELDELKRRYTGLLQEKECAFAHKRRILETNFVRVDKNRRLAEAFKIKDNNAAVSSVQSGSAVHGQQSRQQTIPVSNVRLAQLATPVLHSGSPIVDLPTSCSLTSVSGIQAGGIYYLPTGMQSNDALAAGSQFSARMLPAGIPMQNTQPGQGAQSNSFPHNFGLVSDMININIQPSECPIPITSGGLSTQVRQLQQAQAHAQGNIADVISNVYLSEANSIISQRLQQQEMGNFLGSPNGNSNSMLHSGFIPVHQSLANCNNQVSYANANHANAVRVGADIIESGTQGASEFESGSVELFSLQGPSAASHVERIDLLQASSSNLQEMNNNSIVENFCSTDIQHSTQENVLLEDNGNVGASLVYDNNASDAPILTGGPTSCGLELEVSRSPLLVPVQPNCNNMANSSNTPSVIYLSDDD